MYLWQRLAAVSWWSRNEPDIRAEGANDLAIIERPGRKRLILEISCRTWARARELQRRFGGRVTKFPRDWLARFTREQKIKPLRIRDRLVITNVGGTSASRPTRKLIHKTSGHLGPSHILVPAGPAFGTGQHATTAMSLRLLEQLTRGWSDGWTMVDLGTGSGIFALAAARLGAKRVMAVDIDPMAISRAKANAALNRISNVQFKVADVLHWRLPMRIDVVTANLFSNLLIRLAPKLKLVRWLIVSGILREQEPGVRRALKQNGFVLETVRRRGKWIAAIAANAVQGTAVFNRRGKRPRRH